MFGHSENFVSVPSSGTYLPFQKSLLKQQKIHWFPSPLRGLIFHSRNPCYVKSGYRWFPSPLRGLIFHSVTNFAIAVRHECFRPLFGDLSSIQKVGIGDEVIFKFPSPLRGLIFHSLDENIREVLGREVSVPSSGTYLPFINCRNYRFTF